MYTVAKINMTYRRKRQVTANGRQRRFSRYTWQQNVGGQPRTTDKSAKVTRRCGQNVT